jgi:hypothetical protein
MYSEQLQVWQAPRITSALSLIVSFCGEGSRLNRVYLWLTIRSQKKMFFCKEKKKKESTDIQRDFRSLRETF